MERVVLAMSGGVDSSVAAALLRQQGLDVVGVFMRHGSQPPSCSIEEPMQLPVLSARADHKQGCCSASDAADARRVAEKMDIPFYALNLQDGFDRIMDYFVDEYISGRTPNPCVMCNNWLKFGKLFEYADSIGARYVATGHYAQIWQDDDRCRLARGVDRDKDQSYVLFGVKAELLKRMILPVGEYRKSEIRQMATKAGLRVAGKPDSQEICFVTRGHHSQFVRQRSRQDTSGSIITQDGRVVGTHAGIEAFTIGQRKGLGVALGEPQFVVRIEPQSRRVVIGPKEALARTELTADRLNWLVKPPTRPLRCSVQIRYNSTAQPATVRVQDDGQLRVRFDHSCYGIAPGQAAVCYQGDQVLGGGWIN